jgi:hypothetical protein
MDLAQRFAAAFRAVSAQELAAPELLGSRLSVACTSVLQVAGAGLSVFGSDSMRAPIGSDSEVSRQAERLQFTVGEGPCFESHASGRVLFVGEHLLLDRWPAFYHELVASTPYRAIASLPLDGALSGIGALDLYFASVEEMDRLILPEARAVADLMATALTNQPWLQSLSAVADGSWLDAPAALERGLVAIATGMLTVERNVGFADALALLRAHAYAAGRTVDDVAKDLVQKVMSAAEL